MYYLTKFDDLIWSGFWFILKIIFANLCMSIYEGKGREKITKIWISLEPNELFKWNKKRFPIVFEGLSFDEKIEIW